MVFSDWTFVYMSYNTKLLVLKTTKRYNLRESLRINSKIIHWKKLSHNMFKRSTSRRGQFSVWKFNINSLKMCVCMSNVKHWKLVYCTFKFNVFILIFHLKVETVLQLVCSKLIFCFYFFKWNNVITNRNVRPKLQ